jgi:Na+-transporting methylmalonyl-CoA/oxaloacetate decarboxylase gamma subunit
METEMKQPLDQKHNSSQDRVRPVFLFAIHHHTT